MACFRLVLPRPVVAEAEAATVAALAAVASTAAAFMAVVLAVFTVVASAALVGADWRSAQVLD